MATSATLAAGMAVVLVASAAGAVEKGWVGGDGTWQTAAMWSPSGVPANTDAITLTNGTATYVPGGDLSVAAGGSLRVGPGGRFVQTGGIAWMQLNGSVAVDGGEFDSGTAGQINVGGLLVVSSGVFRARATVSPSGSSTLRFVGGTFDKAGNFTSAMSSRSQFQGGSVGIGNEFQYNANLTVGAGTIRARLIAPQASSVVLNLSGGHLIVTNSTWDGFYQPSGAYINFTEGSTGKLTFTNCAPSQVYDRYFAGATPRLRVANATITAAEMTNLFDVVESGVPGMGNSVDISPKQTQAGLATFVNGACAASQLTATSMAVAATIDDPGFPAADVFACYGTANGALNFGAWANRVPLGAAQAGAAYTSTPALAPDSVYYYRTAATNASGIAFAAPAPAFVMTAPVNAGAPASVAENSVTPAAIVLSRPAANNCASVALSVPFALGGTAELGTHYTLSSGSPATIPPGADSATILLTPIADWASDTNRTVQFTVLPSAQYVDPTNGVATLTLLNAVLPAFPTNAFMGTLSEDSTVAANWSLGVVPAASHVVVFSPEYARRPLSWNPGMTSAVAAWRQPYAFASTDMAVTFHTTPAAPLAIAGDCVLSGGIWNHAGPATEPTNAVAISVGGNLVVGSGSEINAGNGGVNQVSGRARGYHLAGPGYLPSAGDEGTGSSYGGEGATNDVTYGSILNPLAYGSSGRGDNTYFAGAGLIVLQVAGTTTLDGVIAARGFGYTATGRGASTGGTINLTTGRLLGSGALSADGGRDLSYGSGSGGRVRVKLTSPAAQPGDFAGTITAHGNDGIPGSAAGTIAIQTAADAADGGLVIVDNAQFSDMTNAPFRAMCTHLPPRVPGDASLAATTWVLRDHAAVRLTDNVRLAGLTVEGASARLFTESFVATVNAFVVDGVPAGSGTYTADDYPGLLFGSGAVVVPAQGTVLLVR